MLAERCKTALERRVGGKFSPKSFKELAHYFTENCADITARASSNKKAAHARGGFLYARREIILARLGRFSKSAYRISTAIPFTNEKCSSPVTSVSPYAIAQAAIHISFSGMG